MFSAGDCCHNGLCKNRLVWQQLSILLTLAHVMQRTI